MSADTETLPRYNAYRSRSRALTQAEFREIGLSSLALKPLDDKALQAWSTDWRSSHPNALGGWNWREQRQRYASKVQRFDLSVWSGDRLCALALGKDCTGEAACLNLVEREPVDDNPVRGQVLAIVLSALTYYAQLSGRTYIRVFDPDPNLIAKYDKFGLELDRQAKNRQILQRKVV